MSINDYFYESINKLIIQRKMKIYTKTGDKGTTSLIGGKRVPKNHQRIEAYGTVDELIAFLGVVRDHVNKPVIQKNIIKIQDELMICAAILATDTDASRANIPKLSDNSVVWLETEIDKMEKGLTKLTKFILPGGHPAVSFCHVARTICRRAERITIGIEEKETSCDAVVRYLNRLSDYLFVLSRHISVDNQAIEITWQPLLD
jgi:cob(I)alamin adenosyltransferase